MTEGAWLAEGAYDLHVHTGPDVQERKLTDLEMAERAVKMGMGGFAIKSHYHCTAERARICCELYPACDTVGAITLNDSAGGLNPAAVELAARAGARIVWMPTVDSAYERQFLKKNMGNIVIPYWAKMIEEMEEAGVPCPPLSLLDGEGRLKEEVRLIIEVAKKHDICIATAHISHEETFALAQASRKMHFKKLLISHVLYPSTTYTKDELEELIRQGAFLEYSYSTFTTQKTTYRRTVEGIKSIGPQHCIISSDLGMPSQGYPDEGMAEFCRMLYESGVSAEEIRQMNRDNPKYLAGRL